LLAAVTRMAPAAACRSVTLIAVRRQPAAVERIIVRRFADDQIDVPTIRPKAD